MKIINLESNTAFQTAIEAINMPEKIVVCGSASEVERLKENMEYNEESVEHILEKADKIDVSQWFAEKRALLEADYAEEDDDFSEIVGDWDDTEVNENDENNSQFSLAYDILTQEPVADLKGMQLQTTDSWQIPAILKLGGWNECPFPSEQAAVWKHWQEKYGAYIVGVSGDVIEAYVTRPPKTKDEALTLAWEQYLFCCDIVDQGCETVINLAASLLSRDKWFFWWD